MAWPTVFSRARRAVGELAVRGWRFAVRYETPRSEVGAVLVIFAISFTALLGFAALAIDLGNTAQSHLNTQNAADAAALAGMTVLNTGPVSYTHLRAHETGRNLVCRLLLETK